MGKVCQRILGLDIGIASIGWAVINYYQEEYLDVASKRAEIKKVITDEEVKFRATLKRGMREFDKIVSNRHVSGYDAFVLFSTYGFPIEMTKELAEIRLNFSHNGLSRYLSQ